jgi:hypothetical protein
MLLYSSPLIYLLVLLIVICTFIHQYDYFVVFRWSPFSNKCVIDYFLCYNDKKMRINFSFYRAVKPSLEV